MAAPATRARSAIADMLELAGIEAALDPGAFYPQPAGVLVGLPTLDGATLSARRFTVPVLVVSGDPLSTLVSIDRLYALADDVARALSTLAYRPSSYRGSMHAEPLPAIELAVTVTVTEQEASHAAD